MKSALTLLILLSLPGTAIAAEGNAAPKSATPETIEEFLQGLTTIPNIHSRKDPFQLAPAPFSAPAPAVVQQDENMPVMSNPILERYRIAEYEVVAVLVGDKYPRALMRLPADPESPVRKVVIVKEGDKVGNRAGVITKINTEGVLVKQTYKFKKGIEVKSDALLRVGATAEAQKTAFMAPTPDESKK